MPDMMTSINVQPEWQDGTMHNLVAAGRTGRSSSEPASEIYRKPIIHNPARFLPGQGAGFESPPIPVAVRIEHALAEGFQFATLQHRRGHACAHGIWATGCS